MKIATSLATAMLLSGVVSGARALAVERANTHAESCCTCPEPLDAAFPADTLIGTWWSEGKDALLEIVKTKSGMYEVLIRDGKNAENKDVNNPDPKLRDRKLRGVVIMWHLRFEDGEYVDGYCYNPLDGNTYRVKMKVTGPNSLRLRGYLALPILGKNQDWTRAG